MLIGSNNFDLEIENKLWNIFNAVNHSIIITITDSSGRITYVNDKFCEISKYSREELLGQNHRIFKSGHHSDRFYKDIWATISAGNSWTGEIKNKRKDGSYFWVFTSIIPGISKGSTSLEFIAIRFDITEKKSIAEKLNRVTIDLDLAKVEREIREQFISSVSHDLRTPLSIAKMSAHIIEKKYTVTEKVRTLSNRITENINRVDSLITGLLDESRNKELQKTALEFKKMDIVDVISETLENLTTIHGARFKLESPAHLTGHWSLPGIKRILENLGSNAIKYGTPNSAVIVKIIELDEQLLLSVQNKGNPIPESEQKIIFDYLKRSSTAEHSGQNGWGVGLMIVKDLAEAHGGSVKVNSSAEIDGTIFTVTLPIDSRYLPTTIAYQKEKLVIANESDNLLRLFRHMPEIVIVSSGMEHRFEFVSDAYLETFGFNPAGLTIRELGASVESYIPIMDEVYTSGMPKKLSKNPMNIDGTIRYFNQTFVPRKNITDVIIGVLSISIEVDF